MPRPKGSKNKVQGKNKKMEILDAAMTVFSHYGYDGATLEKIAVTAGCTRPLVIQYYGNKETLAKECTMQFISIFYKSACKIHDKAASYVEANRLTRQQFIMHRDKWRFLLGVMCVPALDELRIDLVPRYFTGTKEKLEMWADEFHDPKMLPNFSYIASSIHMGYLIGGDEKNYHTAMESLLAQYIQKEQLE